MNFSKATIWFYSSVKAQMVLIVAVINLWTCALATDDNGRLVLPESVLKSVQEHQGKMKLNGAQVEALKAFKIDREQIVEMLSLLSGQGLIGPKDVELVKNEINKMSEQDFNQVREQALNLLQTGKLPGNSNLVPTGQGKKVGQK